MFYNIYIYIPNNQSNFPIFKHHYLLYETNLSDIIYIYIDNYSYKYIFHQVSYQTRQTVLSVMGHF